MNTRKQQAADEAAIVIVEASAYGYEATVKQLRDIAIVMLTAFTDCAAEAAATLDASIDFVLEACPEAMVPSARYRKAVITRAGAL